MSAPGDEAPIGPSERDALLAPLADAEHLLVAISGGPDSTALLGLLAAWTRARGRPALSAATVDHGLRLEAAGEAEAVAAWCRRSGVSHAVLVWRREEGPSGSVSQAEARRARYELLSAEAARIGATRLVVAHHQDDQAETLLMRMAAGSGIAGLAGMRPESRRGALVLVRPFLGLPKARLVATCRAEGWPFVADPTNARRLYARTRWRDLAPALSAEGLDARRLGALAERLARADAALAAVAEAAFAAQGRPREDGRVSLDLRRLLNEPAEIALRVLGLAVAAVETDPGAALRLDRLETGGAALFAAAREGRGLRRTLAGRVLSLDPAGILIVTGEGARRRGRREALTLPASEPPPSLGTETLRP